MTLTEPVIFGIIEHTSLVLELFPVSIVSAGGKHDHGVVIVKMVQHCPRFRSNAVDISFPFEADQVLIMTGKV
jgi:hypothetical protein